MFGVAATAEVTAVAALAAFASSLALAEITGILRIADVRHIVRTGINIGGTLRQHRTLFPLQFEHNPLNMAKLF